MTTSNDFSGAWRKSSRSASTGDCVELTWRKSSYSADTGACVELAWHKSSHSTDTGDCVELAWRKSSHSADIGECVELAHVEEVFGIRDSKYTDGPVLALRAECGLAFLTAVRGDRLTTS